VTLFSILAALIWDYFQPLRDPSTPSRVADRYVDWLLTHVNAGKERHGMLAWTAGAFVPALLAGLAGALLGELFTLLEWAWNVIVLYFCLGFRQFGLKVADVVRPLRQGDLARAQTALMTWRTGAAQSMNENEVARSGIEQVMLLALTRLFGVLFWFAVLGVFGALFYRLSGMCRDRWQAEPSFCAFPRRLAYYLDWLPARAAAFSFAIVGNFEDAMDCWRNQAGVWGERNEGVLLAAAAGALGVRLGGPLNLPGGELLRPELGCGDAADADYLDGAMSLIWRAVVLWVGVIALLWLGGL
jgi:adenosylcobinamide-phosphate synthase